MHQDDPGAGRVSVEVARGLARMICSGQPTPESFRGAFDRLVTDPGFAPGCPLLCDMREARLDGARTDEMREVAVTAAAIDDHWGPHRVAFVAERDLEFGLARIYEAVADRDGVEIRVFRESEAAERWLRDEPGNPP